MLLQGENYSATIEGWKNLMPKIRLTVDDDGSLLIDDTNHFNFVRSRDNMTTVYLTFSGELNYIHFSGDGFIRSNDSINISDITILCEEASGDMNMKIKAQNNKVLV